MMKAYKTYRKAKENNDPTCDILRVGSGKGKFHITHIGRENYGSMELIDGETGVIVGQVCTKHFRRLGNANWAKSETEAGKMVDKIHALSRALAVFLLDERYRTILKEEDPKALEQALAALALDAGEYSSEKLNSIMASIKMTYSE